ncbi:MAG TPA: hypothetical protein DEA55_04855 [Rhodospirillaceae bacterium]|nr:hypothetical protein [Rhodospirillaceae bacterium]
MALLYRNVIFLTNPFRSAKLGALTEIVNAEFRRAGGKFTTKTQRNTKKDICTKSLVNLGVLVVIKNSASPILRVKNKRNNNVQT